MWSDAIWGRLCEIAPSHNIRRPAFKNGEIFWMNNKAIYYWMRLSRIWRILQISEGIIHLGLRPLWITSSLNSSTIDKLGEWCLERRVRPRIKPSRTHRVSIKSQRELSESNNKTQMTWLPKRSCKPCGAPAQNPRPPHTSTMGDTAGQHCLAFNLA